MENFYGFIPSKIDGSEYIFGYTHDCDIPSEYSCVENLPKVINQGALSICVPCSISAYINYRKNIENNTNADNGVSLEEIYNSRRNKGEGMTYKDAFSFLRKEGVKTIDDIKKISAYAKIESIIDLKYALIANGPCFGALPVYSGNPEFWKKENGLSLKGYHAISLVGYNEYGIIIRNSWGESFGNKGYTIISYEEFDKLIEVWTIIE